MSGDVVVPLELIEVIIDDLAAIDDLKHTSLWACARTCRFLLHLSKRHIFSSITLNGRHDNIHLERHKLSPSRLWKLLKSIPEIPTYVRKLNFGLSRCDVKTLQKDRMLSLTLKKFTLIQQFTVRSDGTTTLKWSDVADCLQDALFQLLTIPPLSELSISNVLGFPVLTLASCTRLRSLHIDSVTPGYYNLPVMSSIHPIALTKYFGGFMCSQATNTVMSLQDRNGRRVFDLQHLEQYAAWCVNEEDSELIRRILKKATKLASIDLTVGDPYAYSLFDETLFRPLKLLGKIAMRRNLYNGSTWPLGGLPRELKTMREQPNNLEELEIYIRIFLDIELSPHNDWCELDDALDHPNWPHLNRVSVYISAVHWENGNREFGWLPELPILSANKNVAFELFMHNTRILTMTPKEWNVSSYI